MQPFVWRSRADVGHYNGVGDVAKGFDICIMKVASPFSIQNIPSPYPATFPQLSNSSADYPAIAAQLPDTIQYRIAGNCLVCRSAWSAAATTSVTLWSANFPTVIPYAAPWSHASSLSSILGFEIF